jgi:hypothetical protein
MNVVGVSWGIKRPFERRWRPNERRTNDVSGLGTLWQAKTSVDAGGARRRTRALGTKRMVHPHRILEERKSSLPAGRALGGEVDYGTRASTGPSAGSVGPMMDAELFRLVQNEISRRDE